MTQQNDWWFHYYDMMCCEIKKTVSCALPVVVFDISQWGLPSWQCSFVGHLLIRSIKRGSYFAAHTVVASMKYECTM